MTKKIELTRGFEAIIDDEDFERVSQYKWRANVTRWGTYAVGWMQIERRGRHVYLHRFLLGLPSARIAFVNGNPLDCRRENLRPATATISQARRAVGANNSTGYKGVSFNKAAKKYKAYIKKDGELLHLGLYETAKQAAIAYNKKAGELFGEFARLNEV